MRTLHPALVLLLAACDGSATVDIPDDVDDDTPAADTDAPDDADTDDTDPVVDTEPTGDTAPPDPCRFEDAVIGDLGARGAATVQRTQGSRSLPGCDMAFTRFTPSTASTSGVVVLSHGFQRARGNMADWADHLASHGIEVVTPDLCHASILDTDHAQNGRDLAALAEALYPGQDVVFAGQSAGGLAAVVAGTESDDAVGVFGLDLTDSGELGVRRARQLTVPLRGLKGDNSSCNSNGNGRAVYGAAADGAFQRIVEGTHCDFESPTDLLCTGVCNLGSLGGRFDDAQQRRAIRAMFTGFVVERLAVDADGLGYWTQGCTPFDTLWSSGILR